MRLQSSRKCLERQCQGSYPAARRCRTVRTQARRRSGVPAQTQEVDPQLPTHFGNRTRPKRPRKPAWQKSHCALLCCGACLIGVTATPDKYQAPARQSQSPGSAPCSEVRIFLKAHARPAGELCPTHCTPDCGVYFVFAMEPSNRPPGRAVGALHQLRSIFDLLAGDPRTERPELPS